MKSFRIVLGLALVCLGLHAQNATLTPVPKAQFLDANGKPLAGGKIYTYAAGTSTPQTSYTDSTAGAANTNPVILDAGGFANIWLGNTLSYKLVVQDSSGATIATADNINNPGALVLGQKGAANGLATLDATTHLTAAQLTLYNQGGAGAASRTITSKLQESVSMEDFSGSDCGAKINSAYAALPVAGGTIGVHSSCSFATPINFGTSGKIAILAGAGSGTTLTYTGSGTAIALNNGRQFDMSTSVRDITLTGPGSGTAAKGIVIGGANGCVGCSVEHSIIQGFGTGLEFNDNTWITRVSQSMIRGNGTNVLLPSGMTEAGENVQFDHVTFADAPAPHTSSVWVQGGGQEIDFTDCSFDQAQLRIGNGATSAAQVNIKGSHFENPNFATGVNYDFITVDNHNGNYVRISDSYFLQDQSAGGPSRFALFSGGKITLNGIGMFTPASSPMTNFAVMANGVNVDLFSFNDLSGNVTGALLGGSTTGFVASIPGANTGGATARNTVMKAADAVGGAAFDVSGNIRASAQLVALAATGTAPLVVSSTTPVANLFAQPVSYSAAGTQIVNSVHLVFGTVALSGGAATVTLSGAAVFTNSSSYVCNASDTSAAAAVRATPTSGTQFTLGGSGSDNVSYSCIGN
jgi:hypothetical protein